MDALTAPVITFSQAWADTIPKRLLDEIPLARLISLITGEQKATIPETVAYIMTRTLESPMNHDWVEIYIHVSCQMCEQYWKENHWDKMQATRNLNDYQKRLLEDLRCWIYNKRREVVKSRMKSYEKEEKAIKEPVFIEAKQLTLF
jgi:hypothetical protein